MRLFNRLSRILEIWQEVKRERKLKEHKESESNPQLKKFKELQEKRAQRINKALQYRAAINKIKEDSKKGDLASVISGLENVIESTADIPKGEELSHDEIKDALYTAGKNHAAIAYAQSGVNPVNLAFIVHNVAKNQKKFLGEDLDYKEYLVSIHRSLFGSAKTHLRRIIGKPNSADQSYSTVQRAEEILEFAKYTPEEKHGKIIEINKLLVGALLPNLRELAFKGLATEFEDVRAKVYEAMDKAQTAPEIRAKTEKLVDIYHGKCYNEHFNNHIKAFWHDVISLEELDQVVQEHNRVFDALDISEEDMKKNKLLPVAGFNANTYRVGINNLLYLVDPASRNGNPVPPEKEARDMVARIKSYLKPAELKPAERKGVVKALRRIDSFYNGSSNGHTSSGGRNGRKNQMYKNPQLDRRARLFTKKHR